MPTDRELSDCVARRGMLPGYVSGFYSYDDCHIDLARLAAFAKARLIHAEANGIDTQVC
jgi:selenide,water dikinase